MFYVGISMFTEKVLSPFLQLAEGIVSRKPQEVRPYLLILDSVLDPWQAHTHSVKKTANTEQNYIFQLSPGFEGFKG